MKNFVAPSVARRAVTLMLCLATLTLVVGSLVAVSSRSAAAVSRASQAVPVPARSVFATASTASRTQNWFDFRSFDYGLMGRDWLGMSPTATSSAMFVAPTISYGGQNRVLDVGGSDTINPTAGPSNATNVQILSTGCYTGGIAINSTSGIVQLFNAARSAPSTNQTCTITVRATNANDMPATTTDATFTVQVNYAPTFTPQAITRTAGNPGTNSTILTNLVDDYTSLASLVVRINGGTSATVNGVTVNNLSLSGTTYTADIVAGCLATTATFILTVTDARGATTTDNLNVTVNPNPPPVLTYPNPVTPPLINQGGALMITPATGPSDNVMITSIMAGSLGGYTGNISVNNTTGVVSLTNAAPGGATITFTIIATDNCGVITSASFKVKINAPPSVAPLSVGAVAGSAALNQTIANINDPEDSAAMPPPVPFLPVMINGGTTATTNGVTVTLNPTATSASGAVMADVSTTCTATTATFNLSATDSNMLTTTVPMTVTVQPNPLPVLSYPSPSSVAAGAGTTIFPSSGPSDNGSLSLAVQNTGGFPGTITVNNVPGLGFGNLTVTGAPITNSNYTVTIRATDNCTGIKDAVFTLHVTAPMVGFSKTHSQPSVQPGETAVFQLNFANTGDQDATMAKITETVPANTTFNAIASSPGWSCPDGSLATTSCVYTVGNIGAGGSGSIFFAVTVVNPVAIGVTQVMNTASYMDSITPATPASDAIAITAFPDMAVMKTDTGVSSGPGGTIVYFVSYSNVGRRNAAGVVLTETVPVNTTFNMAASAPSLWSCADGSPAGTTCTINVGNVAGGGAGTYRFAVDVNAVLVPVSTTQVTNTASITDSSGTDPETGNNTSIDTTPVGVGPVITPVVVARTAGTPGSNVTIASVTDDLAPASSVVVIATSVPAGISVTNITNLGGTIKADVRADCNAVVGNNTIGLKGTDNLGNMTTANLIVAVTANPVPTQGTYPPAGTVNLSAGTTVTPNAAPSDNGSITTIVASAPGFTGNFSVNPASGVVTISNAGPAGSYTVTVTATDNCGATSTRTFSLVVNGAPTITAAAPPSVQQGTAAVGATIATVADDLTPAGSLTVVKTFSPVGISVTGISNSGGTITANIAADCTATLGPNIVGLQVTDGGGLTATTNLTINVTPNTAPTLGIYPATSLTAGTGTTVLPNAAPADNGTVVSLTASAPGFIGSLATNPVTGVVTISNAGPLGTVTVTLTATDNCGASTSTTFTITVTCPTITVTPPVVTTGTVGSLFSQPFTQSGGSGNINFTLNSGTLPTGMTLLSSGVLSGTPTQMGSFPMTVKATDVNGCMGVSATYTLVINCQTITVTSPAVAMGTVGAPFSQNFTQVGGIGAINFTLNSGTLPPGLLLNLNGQLAGTPTTQGSFIFTVKATDGNGCTGISPSYTLVISCPIITLAPASLPSGTWGVAYSQTVTASPAGSYTYGVTAGSLPAGLSLNPTSGAITGTPSAVGTSNFTITATYYSNCLFAKTYSIVILCPAVALVPTNLVTGTIGVAYSQTVAAIPSATYSYAVTLGSLPPGTTLNPGTGVISGTPTLIGTYNFTVTATGAGALTGCTGSQAYTIIINCRTVTLTPPTTLPGGQTGELYNQTISASPAGTYTFSIANGSLPPGLMLNPVTGVINGTPTQAGTYNFSIRATDPDTCAGTQPYVVVINCPVITLAAVTLPSGRIGVAYPATSFTAAPAATYTFAVTSGSLPAGLTLSSAGVLSGTPSQAGSFPFTVTATNGQLCTGSRSYTLVINLCPAITVDPLTLPLGRTGTAYSQTFTATGGTAPYMFTRTGASPLPNGLTLSAAGVLAGTPTQVGAFNFTVVATDANGCTGSRAYSLTINACPAGGCPTGTLTANPDPVNLCNSSVGVTTLTWTASTQVTAVQIRVGSPTGALFTSGNRTGSAPTGNWVTDGMQFFLQDVTNGTPGTTLAQVTMTAITGVACGSSALTSSPVVLCNGATLGESTLTWNSPVASAVQVRVGSANGALFAAGGPSGSAKTGQWASAGMQFFLQDVSLGVPGVTLTTATVTTTTNGCGAGTLSATPNPILVCDGTGLGVTTINWSAPGVTNTQVRLNSTSGPILTSGGPSGSVTTGKWVTNGMQFFLINTGTSATLATATVGLTTAACSSLITANPQPVPVCDGSGLGVTTIHWNAPGVPLVHVRVGSAGGPLFAAGSSTGSAITGKWVTNGLQFFLIDVGNSTTLGSVTVTLTNTGCRAASLEPLRVLMNPVPVCDGSGLGMATLMWDKRPSQLLELRVGAPNGPLVTTSQTSSELRTSKWVSDGMTFYLIDVSTTARQIVGTATIRLTKDSCP